MHKGWIYAAAMLISGAAGWSANGWRMGTQLSEQRTEHIDLLRRTAEANAEVILQQQTERQEQALHLANLDTKHTEELNHALSENRRLEDLYFAADGERRRLRIEVIVARNDAVVSTATSAGSVGDAATLDLSGAAGRVVWDIRRMMLEDRAKLEYLQNLVNTQVGN